jgi:hypothetical protein
MWVFEAMSPGAIRNKARTAAAAPPKKSGRRSTGPPTGYGSRINLDIDALAVQDVTVRFARPRHSALFVTLTPVVPRGRSL